MPAVPDDMSRVRGGRGMIGPWSTRCVDSTVVLKCGRLSPSALLGLLRCPVLLWGFEWELSRAQFWTPNPRT